jgi:hypothetical protein
MSCGGGHLGFPIGMKNRKFVQDLPMIILGQFGFNFPCGLLQILVFLFRYEIQNGGYGRA